MRRENKAMRLASALLVLTLLATSMIAGTFAKYTAEGTGNATARVAKFGVDVTVDTANLFGTMYKDDTDGNIVSTDDNSISVKADDPVVAPGTTGSMTFTVSGKPEVAVELAVEVSNAESKRVMLKQGTYSYKDDKKAAVTVGNEAYYPVKWTLKKDGVVVADAKNAQLQNVDLATINDYFKGDSFTKDYVAGTDLSQEISYTLSWEWAYGVDSNGTNDAKDTLLGDIAADANNIKIGDDYDTGTAITADTDYCLNEAFDFKITVTQAN